MGLDFYIALSGLKAGETMISVAQNNIANANNINYARQRVDVSSAGIPQGSSGVKAQMGSGVWIDQITRIKDDLLIQQVRTEQGKAGYNEGLKRVLSNVETVFNEVGENSISKLSEKIFNGLQEANKFPEQSSYRLELVYSAVLFTEKIKGISVQLDEVKSQADSQLKTEVAHVNNLLEKIAGANKKMESFGGTEVNSLLDERDGYLNELSKLIDINITNKEHPMNMEIKVGNTKVLTGQKYYPIETTYIDEKDEMVLSIGDIKLDLKSGQIKGILESRNEMIGKYEKGLNNYVRTFITEFNNLHTTGYGLDGTTGENFFNGSDMRSIEINPLLKKDPEKIGLSAVDGVSGNTEIGEKLANLRNLPVMGGQSISDFYREYVVTMASELNLARDNEIIHTNVAGAMEKQKQSVQGVNIDEEMTNLMVYQQYYQANARMIKITESMLDEILNLI
jgi:flagellar hook-associated protein 1 FlgK